MNAIAGTCSCLGFAYRKECKHIREIARQKSLFEGLQDERQKERDKLSEEDLARLPDIYTSRYFAYDVLSSGLLIPIRISVYPPTRIPLPYSLDYRLPSITPERWMDGVWSKYASGMWFKLNEHGVSLIAKELIKISEDNDQLAVALLCYEDTRPGGDFCHRLVFQGWFEEKTGIVIPELTNDGELIHPSELKALPTIDPPEVFK